MPRHTCFFFVSSRLALKVTKHHTRKEIHLPSFHACQATVQESYAAARAHARRCAWARWATTAARSAFSSAVAVARRGEARHREARHGAARHGAARHGAVRHGAARHGALASVTCRSVCSAASTVRRLQHGVARRLRHGVYGAAQCGAYCVCAARAHYSLLRVCKGHVLVCNATQIVSTSCTPTLFFSFPLHTVSNFVTYFFFPLPYFTKIAFK